MAKSSILRVVEFVTASLWHFGWEPTLYTTLTTIWVSSSVASRASLEKPKPLPLRPTNLLALCFTYSVQSSLMTKASSRDVSRTLYSVPNSDYGGIDPITGEFRLRGKTATLREQPSLSYNPSIGARK